MNKVKLFLFVFSASIFAAVMSHLIRPDTPVEEVTEDVLKSETGIDVDLSPGDNKF